ncbi:MAG: hypothetical protein HZC28_06245 [Spirochaetes bacterium]|nr:hypothetical protein [Spirochaetota bacterium]
MAKNNHLAAAIAAMVLSGSAGIAQHVAYDKNGRLQIDSGGMMLIDGESLLLMDANWKSVSSPTSAKPALSTSPTGVSLAEWSDKGGTLTRQVSQAKDGTLTVRYEFEFKKGLNGKYIELTLNIPRSAFDSLKPAGKGADVVQFGPAGSVDSIAGTVRIDPAGSSAVWHLQDMREVSWNGQFRMMLSMAYDAENGTKAVGALAISITPRIHPAFVPVTLSTAAARPFIDRNGDGWTGQGSGNDLRILPSGLMTLSGIPFDITGRAVLLKGEHTAGFPVTTGTMQLTAPAACDALYMLQATAWSAEYDKPVATYKLMYADGTSASIPVKYGRDINDWWMARPPTDAKLAWTGANGSAEVGLSVMKVTNPRPDKQISGIEFVSAQTAATPILIAATVLKSGVLTAAETEAVSNTYTKRDQAAIDMSDWYECPIAWRGTIQPGSALDFSGLNHKPAGKFGFVKSRNGVFEFEKEPGKPVRFWGINFAIAGPFPDKELAAGIAQCAAAQGVNLVRLHLYASSYTLLVGDNGEINKEMLDKMEFLVAELEKNGIYIFMDLNDGLPYEAMNGMTNVPFKNLKLASIFDPELRKATKRLATELFTHVNPYNGKPLASDPGVAMFEIINECSMFIDWGTLQKSVPEPYLGKLKVIWSEWLAKNGIADRPLPDSFKVDNTTRKFAEELQLQYLQEMGSHLRSLGIRAPISGDNITFALGELRASVNAKMDYIGEHSYFDHPNVSSRPMTYNDNKAITRPVSQLPLISDLAKGALNGYPLVNGEWNFCFPNDYRCEGIPYAAAYAGYQDWGGMVFYCATGSFDGGRWSRFTNNPGILIHSQQTDPATWGLSHVGAALYRRGDVAPAKRDLEAILPDSAIDDNILPIRKMPFLPALGRYRMTFSGPDGKSNWLGDLSRSDLAPADAYRKVLEKIGDTESGGEYIVSDTKQIRRYAAMGLLFIDTPKTQSVNGRLCDIPKSGDGLSGMKVESAMTWASVNVTSIDGKDISSSGRLLVTAVGNARNKTTKIDAAGGLIFNMGAAPVIAEPVNAKISIKNAAGTKVFVINPLTGERVKTIPSVRSGDTLTFSIDNGCKSIYFEVAAN